MVVVLDMSATRGGLMAIKDLDGECNLCLFDVGTQMKTHQRTDNSTLVDIEMK